MTTYPEINKYGLTEYHKQELCYPYTPTPAFKFWAVPVGDVGPEHCPIRSWQDGRCGLCGFRAQLVEDHCHDTGLVRGMLCKSCNTTEGRGSGRNMEQWRDGVTVAVELGIEEVYVDIFGQTPTRLGAPGSPEGSTEERAEVKRRIASAVMW